MDQRLKVAERQERSHFFSVVHTNSVGKIAKKREIAIQERQLLMKLEKMVDAVEE